MNHGAQFCPETPLLRQRTVQHEGLHVAVIMDGNGRWATSRGLPRMAGHRAGVTAVRRAVECAPDLGISLLTLYAFSSDNWRRPSAEIESIFFLVRTFLRLEAVRLRRSGVQLQVIGRRDRLPASVLHAIERAERVTAEGNRLCLRIAIDYSSRGTIVRAAADSAAYVCDGTPLNGSSLEGQIMQALALQGKDVDLLIRTGGEQRLSDFLLWECAYAELFFSEAMWPDFDGDDLACALRTFRLRNRRFGGLQTVASASSAPTPGDFEGIKSVPVHGTMEASAIKDSPFKHG